MNEARTVTLVWEHNYALVAKHRRWPWGPTVPDESLASVWLFDGDGQADFDREEPFAEIPGWTKVVGPVNQELASEIHAALKKFFVESGVTVIDEGVCD